MKDVDSTIIGRVELVDFIDGDVFGLHAKIDTGAYRSSIWATNIYEKDGILHFALLGPKSPNYSGEEIQTKEYKVVEVENSFGHKQDRYSVFLRVRIKGKLIKSNFTLANRELKTYSALIGRKMLRKRFVVDVATGEPLPDEELNGDNNL
ncbi:ATP-dependent zinc protease [Candidatus Saccharibacteria bacterium]|nr:ATP-dependent zinc protease [Candidatus Saccharibacteria bacterium]MBI3338230.1 ATP-dependent zinc protease [Candidatus Saccharibacteria bacterium]